MEINLRRARKVALRAARKAAKLQRKEYGKAHKLHMKVMTDYATEVDINSEKIIHEYVHKYFPTFSFVGEEGDKGNLKAEWVWVVDPLDGTHCFVNEIPFFGPSIALLHNGKPVVAAVVFPMLREEYTAILGQGTKLNGRKLQIVDRRSMRGIQLVGGSGPMLWADKLWEKYRTYFSTAFIIPALIEHGRRVLKGIIPASPASNTHFIWDQAAMDLLVREAGGRVSTWKGKELTYDQMACHEGVFFSTPGTYREMLGYLKDVKPRAFGPEGPKKVVKKSAKKSVKKAKKDGTKK